MSARRLWILVILFTLVFWVWFAQKAFACDGYVAHLGSYHTDRSLIDDVNEVNPGIGCRFDNGVEIGYYKNSYHDDTFYGVWDTTSDGWGLFAGVASGYAADTAVAEHGITPVGGVVYHSESTTTRIMPSYNANTGNLGMVMSFSVKFGF